MNPLNLSPKDSFELANGNGDSVGIISLTDAKQIVAELRGKIMRYIRLYQKTTKPLYQKHELMAVGVFMTEVMVS